jgi:hypothetical protein
MQLPSASCVAAVLGLALGEILTASVIITVAAVGAVLSFTFFGGAFTVYFAKSTGNERKHWRRILFSV